MYLFFRVLIWSELKRRFGKIERRFILLKQRFAPPETAFCQAWNEASERQKITFFDHGGKKKWLARLKISNKILTLQIQNTMCT